MDGKKSVLVLIFVLTHAGNIQANEAGFNEICQIYTEAKNSSMAKDQLNNYINDNVAKRISEKDAIITHSIIYQVTPAERYKIFKESAEHSLKRKWDCPAMKALMK